jgi:predicted outer membrane repeat protein
LGSEASFVNCTFSDNQTVDQLNYSAGGGLHSWQGALTFSGCLFTGNSGGQSGGGACFVNCTPTLDQCTFVLNSAEAGAGLACCLSTVQLSSCTFCENSANDYGGAISCGCESEMAIETSILAFNTASGPEPAGGALAVVDPQSIATLSCCDLYGNFGGDWIGGFADQLGMSGNFSSEPCFCADSYLIARRSPCFPDSNECGVLIGAWGDACDECGEPAPPLRTTWGQLKALFRPGQ